VSERTQTRYICQSNRRSSLCLLCLCIVKPKKSSRLKITNTGRFKFKLAAEYEGKR